MARHNLKTWPEYFNGIVSGAKTFEVRKNDRGFNVGDTLIFEEYNPENFEYTGRQWMATVSYLLPGGQFGIAVDYCVMGLR